MDLTIIRFLGVGLIGKDSEAVSKTLLRQSHKLLKAKMTHNPICHRLLKRAVQYMTSPPKKILISVCKTFMIA